MKPYFAISFLIVFMQIYALGAEETPHTDEQGSGDGTPETTISTTCKINSTIKDSDGEITCDAKKIFGYCVRQIMTAKQQLLPRRGQKGKLDLPHVMRVIYFTETNVYHAVN